MPRIEDTFSMYMRMLLGMAAVFQMPALVFFMARMGVVTARWMIRQFKYAILVIVVIAAIITPSSDVASQMIVAGPMVVLYVLSIAIAWMFGKKEADCRHWKIAVDWQIGRIADESADLRLNSAITQSTSSISPICHCFDHVVRLDFQHFLRPAIAKLHHSVLQSLGADRQAQGHAEQIGVLELDARAQPVAIVVQHLESGAFEIGFDLIRDRGDLRLRRVEADQVHVIRRDRPGPDDAVGVVVLFDDRRNRPRDADAVAAHHHGTLRAGLVEIHAVHRREYFVPSLKTCPTSMPRNAS